MAIMIYQHRTLVSTAGYDQVTGKWKYAATISWSEIGSVTRFHFVATSPEVFNRFEVRIFGKLERAMRRDMQYNKYGCVKICGKLLAIVLRAFTPPVEVPITMISRFAMTIVVNFPLVSARVETMPLMTRSLIVSNGLIQLRTSCYGSGLRQRATGRELVRRRALVCVRNNRRA